MIRVTYKDAAISTCGRYRYSLTRSWRDNEIFNPVVFIGLNPSTADGKEDDPTIRRCMNFAFDWGYNGIIMMNLFAYRATDPKKLTVYPFPIGRENDDYLITANKYDIVACWGNQGTLFERDKEVNRLIPKMYCIKINGSGSPAHPLYLRKDSKMSLWKIPEHPLSAYI